MRRLNVTAEGKTEQQFVVQVLRPHLRKCGVYVAKPRLTAIGKKKGRVHRGGMARYHAVRNDIGRWLKEDQNQDVCFTTMVDLYGLPNDFPGYDEAVAISDPYGRVKKLEIALEEDIGDRRFIPYIQLHEFEALLLSDPTAFGCYYEGYDRTIEANRETNPRIPGSQTNSRAHYCRAHWA